MKISDYFIIMMKQTNKSLTNKQPLQPVSSALKVSLLELTQKRFFLSSKGPDSTLAPQTKNTEHK